jgi:hypothetical protein
MKQYYDYMRLPIKGSSDFWQVVRAGNQSYNVYNLNVEVYPDKVTIYHYLIDVNNYTKEDLNEYVSTWGYRSLEAFGNYLEIETEVKNHELSLCTCIIENDTSIQSEIAFEGSFEEANGFILRIMPSETDPEDHNCLRC